MRATVDGRPYWSVSVIVGAGLLTRPFFLSMAALTPIPVGAPLPQGEGGRSSPPRWHPSPRPALRYDDVGTGLLTRPRATVDGRPYGLLDG